MKVQDPASLLRGKWPRSQFQSVEDSITREFASATPGDEIRQDLCSMGKQPERHLRVAGSTTNESRDVEKSSIPSGTRTRQETGRHEKCPPSGQAFF